MLDTPQGAERAFKRKRQLTPSSPTEIIRHKTLYLEDGDIVLTALHDDGRVAFRVDKIFLARHSPIFKDMLAFSPGHGIDDLYDGVPRVDLTDNAEDLAVLLCWMYNMPALAVQKFDADKPLRLGGPIRLAKKYEVDEVVKTLIKGIEDDWPKSPDDYGSWHAERDRIVNTYRADFWKHIPEPASAMQFATEFDCSLIVTAVMYHLARSTPFGVLANHDSHGVHSHRVRWHLLDSTNLYRVLRAQRVYRQQLSLFKAIFACVGIQCVAGSCHVKIKKIVNEGINEECDILYFCSIALNKFRSAGVCNVCISLTTASIPAIDKLKTDLWSLLSTCASAEPIPWRSSQVP